MIQHAVQTPNYNSREFILSRISNIFPFITILLKLNIHLSIFTTVHKQLIKWGSLIYPSSSYLRVLRLNCANLNTPISATATDVAECMFHVLTIGKFKTIKIMAQIAYIIMLKPSIV